VGRTEGSLTDSLLFRGALAKRYGATGRGGVVDGGPVGIGLRKRFRGIEKNLVPQPGKRKNRGRPNRRGTRFEKKRVIEVAGKRPYGV